MEPGTMTIEMEWLIWQGGGQILRTSLTLA
jgi:hypothetical protein